MPSNANVYDVKEAEQDQANIFTWAFTPQSTARPEEKRGIYDVVLVRLFNKDALSKTAYQRTGHGHSNMRVPLHKWLKNHFIKLEKPYW